MKHWLSLSLFLLIASNSYPQQVPIRFQQITPKNGLSQGHILCMLQDREGYIWIGTYHGLNRYNGNSIRIFKNDPSDTNSLANNVVYSLYQDEKGIIWVGTAWGLDKYDPHTERFSHIGVIWGDNVLSHGHVAAIAEDRTGNFWIATHLGGLDRIDAITGKITYIRAKGNSPDSLNSDILNDLIIDKKNRLWIGTEDGGLSRMDLVTGRIHTFRHSGKDPHSLISDKITCVYADKQGTIWMGNTEGYLIKYNEKTEDFTECNFLPSNLNFDHIRILDILEDNNGNLLLASNGAGMIIYNCTTGKSQINLHQRNNPLSIASNESSSLLVDRDGTVFVGTYGRGISTYSPYTQKFQPHFVQDEARNFGDVNAFTAAVQDGKGNLIIGTYYGFFVFDTINWSYKHFVPGNEYEDNKILTIAIAPDSSLWLTSNRSIHRYDKNFRKTASYILLNDRSDHPVYSIYFDHLKNLWAGLFTVGLVRIPYQEWRNNPRGPLKYSLYQIDYNDTTSISGNQDWVITQDNDQHLYIGNEGGLSEYVYNTGKFIRYVYPGNIKDIEFDKQGFLWLATSGNGLFRFDLSDRSLKQYTSENGLSHNFVFGIAMDRWGRLWMNTEAGLSRFDPDNEKFRNYDIYDGLPDDHFDDESEAVLPNGDIYMGTSNGFVVFDPGQIKDDTSRSKVILTNILIDNKSVLMLSKERYTELYKVPVDQIHDLVLKYNQRTLSLEFTALNFTVPQKIKYAYRLDGFDKGWNYTDARNLIARYTNLDGGRYDFMVKATNSDDVWTEQPLKIAIRILPPFYMTVWFKILALLSIAITVSLAFRWRIVREVKQREKLEIMVDTRTQEVTEKNKLLETTAYHLQSTNRLLAERQQYIEEQSDAIYRQRDELQALNATKDKLFSIIAHDLKTPFNVIMGFSELLLMNFGKHPEGTKKKYIARINQSAQNTLILLDNLLQWSRSQQSSMIFNPVNESIEKIVKQGINEVKDAALHKNIRIKLRVDTKGVYVIADPQMLTTVIRNLITNAIKFSEKESTVQIRVGSIAEEKMALVTIADKGVGMSVETIAGLFNLETNRTSIGTAGEKGTGLGLVLCKDFINLHKGKIWVVSEIGEGSSFFFTVPLADK